MKGSESVWVRRKWGGQEAPDSQHRRDVEVVKNLVGVDLDQHSAANAPGLVVDAHLEIVDWNERVGGCCPLRHAFACSAGEGAVEPRRFHHREDPQKLQARVVQVVTWEGLLCTLVAGAVAER